MTAHRFRLWRQDDNGNRFEVALFRHRRDAEQRLAALAAGGHKQLYWIEALPASSAGPDQQPRDP